MGCTVLSDRQGTPLADIVGARGEPALIIRAVDISEACPALDLGTRVVLSYVRDKHSHLVVHAALETPNGVEAKWWWMRSVRRKNLTRLRGFSDFARKVTLSQAVLVNYILDKCPNGS